VTAAIRAAAVLALLIVLRARAHAYTFVEEVPEDPCERARAFDPQDTTLVAQKARRACRLAAFERRLASERKQAIAAEQDARDAWVQKWMAGTQPSRVINPIAIEAFAGSGIANYGLVASWTVLRQLELAGRLGQRQMSCASSGGGSTTGGDCTRTTWNLGARYFLGDRDFAPFVGAGFSATSAPLAIVHVDQMGNGGFLQGHGRASSLNASGGVQLATGYFRMSVEYVYEYVFYTGANLDDMQKTPSEDLRLVWEDSLQQDRHGVRFQVGFAF
jgi:hypothetical protein